MCSYNILAFWVLEIACCSSNSRKAWHCVLLLAHLMKRTFSDSVWSLLHKQDSIKSLEERLLIFGVETNKKNKPMFGWRCCMFAFVEELTKQFLCETGNWTCDHDQTTFPFSLLCDGYHCVDRTDESYCKCGREQWICLKQTECIPKSKVCDGICDCGTDCSDDAEHFCTSMWKCPKGQMIRNGKLTGSLSNKICSNDCQWQFSVTISFLAACNHCFRSRLWH